jgi:hypothetical protein
MSKHVAAQRPHHRAGGHVARYGRGDLFDHPRISHLIQHS